MIILVVDDDVQSLRTLERLLNGRGHEVMPASGGQAGLDILQTRLLDVVIADIQMPGVNGLTLLRWMRDRGIALPVVLMTGYATLDTAIQGLRLGASDYLQKPIKVEELVACIDKLDGSTQSGDK